MEQLHARSESSPLPSLNLAVPLIDILEAATSLGTNQINPFINKENPDNFNNFNIFNTSFSSLPPSLESFMQDFPLDQQGDNVSSSPVLNLPANSSMENLYSLPTQGQPVENQSWMDFLNSDNQSSRF